MTLKAFDDLITRYCEISTLSGINEILHWDQHVYMPPGAVPKRGEQISYLTGVKHGLITSGAMGDLLKELRGADGLDIYQRAIVREIEREYERGSSIPGDLVRRISKHETRANSSWIRARKRNDFSIFSPDLETMVSLKKELAEHVGYRFSPYDALLDEFEPYMTSEMISELFLDLRSRLVPRVKRFSEIFREGDGSVLRGEFPKKDQEDLCNAVLDLMHYDKDRGRLDVSAHPFTIGHGLDVRITTRYDENDLRPALFGTIHEGGHALYNQGLDPDHYHDPIGEPASLGIHESQSRLWENMVGRSRPFLGHILPLMKRTFPSLKRLDLETLYRAINVVKPSLIRVESDEVTYNLHVMVRFEIETGIIEGDIDVKDIPGRWDELYEKYLGVRPGTNADGCLQDIHWSMGYFGYFPTYTLGNLYSAQLYHSALSSIEGLEEMISGGDLLPLLEWLGERIHKPGKLYPAAELIRRATGKEPAADDYIRYLDTKYREFDSG